MGLLKKPVNMFEATDYPLCILKTNWYVPIVIAQHLKYAGFQLTNLSLYKADGKLVIKAVQKAYSHENKFPSADDICQHLILQSSLLHQEAIKFLLALL